MEPDALLRKVGPLADEPSAIFIQHCVIKMLGWLNIDFEDIDQIYILKIYIQSSEYFYYALLNENR